MHRFQIRTSSLPREYTAAIAKDNLTVCCHCGSVAHRPLQSVQIQSGQPNPVQLLANFPPEPSHSSSLKPGSDDELPLKTMTTRYPIGNKIQVTESLGWFLSICISLPIFGWLLFSFNFNFDLSTLLILVLYGLSPLLLTTGLLIISLLNKIFAVQRPQATKTPSGYWALHDLIKSYKDQIV